MTEPIEAIVEAVLRVSPRLLYSEAQDIVATVLAVSPGCRGAELVIHGNALAAALAQTHREGDEVKERLMASWDESVAAFRASPDA